MRYGKDERNEEKKRQQLIVAKTTAKHTVLASVTYFFVLCIQIHC